MCLGIGQNYTDTDQVCKKYKSDPIGITESKRKLLCIFTKIQYTLTNRNKSWWTFGFEAFGVELYDDPEILSGFISGFLSNYSEEYLNYKNSQSYPEWIKKFC